MNLMQKLKLRWIRRHPPIHFWTALRVVVNQRASRGTYPPSSGPQEIMDWFEGRDPETDDMSALEAWHILERWVDIAIEENWVY